jgi:hypothetical protein
MNDQLDNWKYRRRAVFGTLLFVGFAIGYMLFKDNDDDLNAKIVDSLTTLAEIVIFAYIVGPVADDFLRRKFPNVSISESRVLPEGGSSRSVASGVDDSGALAAQSLVERGGASGPSADAKQ